MTIPELVSLTVAALACATDLRSARIPNWLTLSAVAAGLAYHAFAPTSAGASAAGLGLLAGVLVFFPFFALGALGAGDVKLMAAIGSWLGWLPVVYVALYGAIAGGVLAIIVSLWHGYLGRAVANLKALLMHWWVSGVRPLPELTLDGGHGLRLPYALPIMAGLVVTLWFG
jgi:prepilin peptidase CpaA